MAKSNAEAKYISTALATHQAIWLHKLLCGFGFKLELTKGFVITNLLVPSIQYNMVEQSNIYLLKDADKERERRRN